MEEARSSKVKSKVPNAMEVDSWDARQSCQKGSIDSIKDQET